MGAKRYSQKDLDTILEEFRSGIPLNEPARRINRSPYGIALKMIDLSTSNPEEWNPQEVKKYTHVEIRKHRGDVIGQKRRWRLRHGRLENRYEQIDLTKFKIYLLEFTKKYPQKKSCAYALKTCPSRLSHYLAGRIYPSQKFLMKLAEAQKIAYDTLVERMRVCQPLNYNSPAD